MSSSAILFDSCVFGEHAAAATDDGSGALSRLLSWCLDSSGSGSAVGGGILAVSATPRVSIVSQWLCGSR